MKMAFSNNENISAGLEKGEWLLAHPVLPLVQIVQFLYYSGPFEQVGQVLAELVEPIETASAVYENPSVILAFYLPALQDYEQMKGHGGSSCVPTIYDEEGRQLDGMAALEAWVTFRVLDMELEILNSELCRPWGCALCCSGPEAEDDKHEFFHIPLRDSELCCLDLPRFESDLSREATPLDEPPLQIGGEPFYRKARALYRWKNGWSMVLPRGTACPGLDSRGGCSIYQQRPAVCRKPQIFNYLLEESDDEPGSYVTRGKLLAVWDCPYVQRFKETIAAFAEISGLEPVFRQNKK